jgi:excisionase family DNA binding protein
MTKRAVDVPPVSLEDRSRLLLRPTEVADALGFSRSKTYELIASGVIPSIRVANMVRVPVEALRAWIDQQLADQRRAS